MKLKKLEKRIQFIFKRKNIVNLTKEQMRKINGGDNPTSGNDSGLPGCQDVTNQATVSS